MIRGLLILWGMLSLIQSFGQQLSGTVLDEKGQPLEASIFVDGAGLKTDVDAKGNFRIEKVKIGTYKVVAFAPGYETAFREITFRDGEKHDLSFVMKELVTELSEVTVEDKRDDALHEDWLSSVNGAAIYEAKKTELIKIDALIANKAANVGRQVYARVPGLNIWENDGAGINLGIGGRGLNPNRTSNFNVRQNGYDISADALGYPESYYTPPVLALDRIELIRGAAGLQYGTQFGGMLNFKFKEGPKDKKIELNSSNNAGSFGLVNSFNSLGGTVGRLSYYTFYQYKTSDGWRPNSHQDQHVAYASLKYCIMPFLDVKVEHTYMTYLAQQPGGLTDDEFYLDPQQSKRTRNWFDVGWNLTAMEWNYRISPKLKLNNKTFLLSANRYAVGNLESIVDADVLDKERNLLKDDYLNIGNELRAIFHYNLLNRKSVLAFGNRVYLGNTYRTQGLGSSSQQPDFEYIKVDSSANSEYHFPNKNMSFFIENIFNLSEHISITPGMRYEYIKTVSDGYYQFANTDLAGNVISIQRRDEFREKPRSFVLLGIGASYKKKDMEVYTNISQNYRSINFNDIRVINPSLVVDENITDEFGYNIDIGIRGTQGKYFKYDLSTFFLRYNQRIGNTPYGVSRLRTNIGDSYVTGIESYFEYDILRHLFDEQTDKSLSYFLNVALIKSEYLTSTVSKTVVGKRVELAPAVNIKSGLTFKYHDLGVSFLYSYTSEQYTEATNSKLPSSSFVDGPIPAYFVMDVSASYKYKFMKLEAGVNNLTNEYYFTRRAAGYPGPGIIPANPRNYYVGIGLKF